MPALPSESSRARASIGQGVPADLESVTMRLLAYDREERYQMAELAAAGGAPVRPALAGPLVPRRPENHIISIACARADGELYTCLRIPDEIHHRSEIAGGR